MSPWTHIQASRDLLERPIIIIFSSSSSVYLKWTSRDMTMVFNVDSLRVGKIGQWFRMCTIVQIIFSGFNLLMFLSALSDIVKSVFFFVFFLSFPEKLDKGSYFGLNLQFRVLPAWYITTEKRELFFIGANFFGLYRAGCEKNTLWCFQCVCMCVFKHTVLFVGLRPSARPGETAGDRWIVWNMWSVAPLGNVLKSLSVTEIEVGWDLVRPRWELSWVLSWKVWKWSKSESNMS